MMPTNDCVLANMDTSVRALVNERYAELASKAEAQGLSISPQASQQEAIKRVLVASDFAFEVWQRQPFWLTAEGVEHLSGAFMLDPHLPGFTRQDDKADSAMHQLRQFRHAEALRLLFRDVNQLASLEETLTQTSQLYEHLLASALALSEASMRERFGRVLDSDGQEVRLVILALGKLGGGELNFSSDVDLVLAYRQAGTSDGKRGLDAYEYFVRLIRTFVKYMSEPTSLGIAARVDLRLRPFGQSGRLAMSFAAMENYYQREGRDWERYAWIKARPVAGDIRTGYTLLDTLRPFIYRKYLDFTAFAGLRDMKERINAEVARKDLSTNLKLGAGGIREIEFIVQLMQLIRGGRESQLRTSSLLSALARGEERGYLPHRQVLVLRESYLFLRLLENRLQMWRDTQIHDIPEDLQVRKRIALAMGYADWSELADQLHYYRTQVAAEFASVLVPHNGANTQVVSQQKRLWQQLEAGTLEVEDVASLGFDDAKGVYAKLQELIHATSIKAMSARGRERLSRLMPSLLEVAKTTTAPSICVLRLIRLVEAVARRSAYLALLDEQPGARKHVADLFAVSAYLADCVIAQPLLLDDVLEPRMQQLPLNRQTLGEEIEHSLEVQDEQDIESELKRVTELKNSLAFRLALAFVDGYADAAQTTRRLAALANAVVAVVLRLACQDLINKHGRLPGQSLGFCVLGYGSLGGQSLGFTSDLDLVFLFDGERGNHRSDGARPLDGFRWYQRLAQRMVHWLSTLTPAGRLYEVDTRLRPDGSKSLLVASLESFRAYQQERAWVWEHQALLRARMVAGDEQLGHKFAHIRRSVLSAPRDIDRVRQDVLSMRKRWRQRRDRSSVSQVDLKQGAGALLDIDFLLQGLGLSYAADFPVLLDDQTNDGLLAALWDKDIVSESQYRALAAAQHQLLEWALACTLDNRPRVVNYSAALAATTREVLQVAHELGYGFH